MIFQNKTFESSIASTFVDPKTNQPIKPEQCIFLDIETVSGCKSYEEVPADLQRRWKNKVDRWIKYSENSKAKILDALFQEFEDSKGTQDFNQNLLYEIYLKNKEQNVAQQYKDNAGLYPEYAKIICISIGSYKDGQFQKISFVGSELELLENFQFGVQATYNRLNKQFGSVWIVGHQVSLFDIPFLVKRMTINGLLIPNFLHLSMTPPWNKKIIDTASEWRAGNTTGDATLETISILLDLHNPKNGITGEKLFEYYYSDSKQFDINVVVDYCEGDVETSKQLFEKLQNLKVMKNIL